MESRKKTSFDVTYEEKIRMLRRSPAQYFAENPRPQFGFPAEKPKRMWWSRKKVS